MQLITRAPGTIANQMVLVETVLARLFLSLRFLAGILAKSRLGPVARGQDRR